MHRHTRLTDRHETRGNQALPARNLSASVRRHSKPAGKSPPGTCLAQAAFPQPALTPAKIQSAGNTPGATH